ncbi:hypothetical protein EV356DRAFT_509581 [Viridothelium virens]|uniref:Uncharacterized protein n=1 Tax=Viridothelium virens TaxID=1048519 RepID=A0A6A6HIL5_VIRVR|nr:hypothetical protein EV356DRAFT_509581 [Viridothelium virens]
MRQNLGGFIPCAGAVGCLARIIFLSVIARDLKSVRGSPTSASVFPSTLFIFFLAILSATGSARIQPHLHKTWSINQPIESQGRSSGRLSGRSSSGLNSVIPPDWNATLAKEVQHMQKEESHMIEEQDRKNKTGAAIED